MMDGYSVLKETGMGRQYLKKSGDSTFP